MNTKKFIHGCVKGVVFAGVLGYAGMSVVEQPVATIICALLLAIVSCPIDYEEGDSK